MSEGHNDHGHGEQSFISKYVFSFDHKMIGKQYLTLAMFMALVGGILAMLVRLQLGWPGTQWPMLETFFPVGMASGVMTPEFYVMLFTMHGTIMVFFVLSLAPVSGGPSITTTSCRSRSCRTRSARNIRLPVKTPSKVTGRPV